VKVCVNKRVLSLDLKTDRESLIRTACGSEFQADGAENRKARLEKSVLVNGWTSCSALLHLSALSCVYGRH